MNSCLGQKKELFKNYFGSQAKVEDFSCLNETSDHRFTLHKNDVLAILGTADKKVEFVFFHNHTLAYVKSSMGYPAYYPLRPVVLEKPVMAVLMDLDGTSVRSEEFWIWIIQLTTA
ncbi:MAG: hypothetical protein ABFD91_13465, partial [Anaerohalosphaeraceae bacterium]